MQFELGGQGQHLGTTGRHVDRLGPALREALDGLGDPHLDRDS